MYSCINIHFSLHFCIFMQNWRIDYKNDILYNN